MAAPRKVNTLIWLKQNLIDNLLPLALEHPFLSAFALLILFFIIRRVLKYLSYRDFNDVPRKYLEDADKTVKKDHYDVAIVGAGPAGSCCGYFLGKLGRKVLLLEKEKFPRDKFCGDAVCKTGIEILHEMGIYDQLLKENKARVADNGGLVSPGGMSFIGRSKEYLGEIPAALACKRIHLDNAIAMAAKKGGADLKEKHPVTKATFDKKKGLWTIEIEGKTDTFQARVLVCADGATSKLGTQLGIVKRPPTSNCSRSYVESGTHRFNADGVIFYNRELLPGYSALFKHADGDLNYCVYIIPGNPKVTPDDLSHWHEKLKTEDPNISKALGDKFKIERMRAASLRLGGMPVSTGNHLLLVGDAAGMIDPMTGEGIHHAMEGGKMAAEFLEEALNRGNYSRQVMRMFHNRWMEKFGDDYKWSMAFCQLTYRFPILLDAATAALNRKGDQFLARWADIMTGRVPKIHLLKPEFSVTITYELLVLLAKKMIGMKKQRKEE